MQPQFEDEAPVNPFDFWKGANLKLKIRNVEGYRNYDKSEFEASAPLSADDDELEKVWGKQYSLTEFLDPKNFKSYEELKAKLDMVLSATGTVPQRAADTSLMEERPRPQPAKAAPKKADLDDEDESLSYFAKLANSD